MDPRPSVVILAGPNGAGKSTAASQLLRGPLAVADFVNADDIALERSPSDPTRVAVAAGREMLARLNELARQRRPFAFETTLAARHFAGWLKALKQTGYAVHLLFLWVPSADFARTRVEGRVMMGDDSSVEGVPRLIAAGSGRTVIRIVDPTTWTTIERGVYGRE